MSQHYKFSDPPKIWRKSRGLFPEPYNFWPQLKLWEVDNVRAVVAESQLFLYAKLAHGLHPRALEQIIYRRYMDINPTVENAFAMNFLQLSLQMLGDLQRGAACKGLRSLEEYKTITSNPAAHFEFRMDMRRRFHSMVVIFEEGMSPGIYEELADSPLLNPSQLALLGASLEEVETIINLQMDFAEAQLATENPESYLDGRFMKTSQRNSFAGISTSDTSIPQISGLTPPLPPPDSLGGFIKPRDFGKPSAAQQVINGPVQYIVLRKRLPSLHSSTFTSPEPGRCRSQSFGSLPEFAQIEARDATIKPPHRMTGDSNTTIEPPSRILHISDNELYQECSAPILPLRRRRRSTQGDGDRYGSQEDTKEEAVEGNENQSNLKYQVNFMAPKRRRVASNLRIRTFHPGEPFGEGINQIKENEDDDALVVR